MTDLGHRFRVGAASVLRRCAEAGVVISVLLFPDAPRAEFADPKAAKVAGEILKTFSKICLRPFAEGDLPLFADLQPKKPVEVTFSDDLGIEVAETSYEIAPFFVWTTLINEEEYVACAAGAEASLQAARIFIFKLERMWPMKSSTGFETPPLNDEPQDWVGGNESVLDDTGTETVFFRMGFTNSVEPGIVQLIAVRLPEGSKLPSGEVRSD